VLRLEVRDVDVIEGEHEILVRVLSRATHVCGVRHHLQEVIVIGHPEGVLRLSSDDHVLTERDAFEQVPVYDGHAMRCGQRISGPAIVEQQTTAIFVSEAYDCTVDALGSFVVYAKGREDLVGQAAVQPEEAMA
jgi:N-methylhydantoinase A/oxoprolinase/acetone carboxylase beta subunit